MQTGNTLILTDNDFANKQEVEIKVAKIMTKDWEHFTSTQSLKFNMMQIKLNSKGIVLTKKSHIGRIYLVIDHNVDFTNSKRITRKKLLPKE